MPWPRRREGPPPPLETPLAEVDPDRLEVIEVTAVGRLAGVPAWADEDSPHEPPYAAGARDPGSLAGIWDALSRA